MKLSDLIKLYQNPDIASNELQVYYEDKPIEVLVENDKNNPDIIEIFLSGNESVIVSAQETDVKVFQLVRYDLYQELLGKIEAAKETVVVEENKYAIQDMSDVTQILVKIQNQSKEDAPEEVKEFSSPMLEAFKKKLSKYIEEKKYLIDAYEKDPRDYDTKHYVMVIYNLYHMITGKDLVE